MQNSRNHQPISGSECTHDRPCGGSERKEKVVPSERGERNVESDWVGSGGQALCELQPKTLSQGGEGTQRVRVLNCLLYTSDAADDC